MTARAEERWTNMVEPRCARRRSPSARAATTSGPTFPGKPKRYLLNSGGRPKLFSIIADVIANDYDSFTFSGSAEQEEATG